jgi:predicted TIM-barrel fold metal-dependent hydrolase
MVIDFRTRIDTAQVPHAQPSPGAAIAASYESATQCVDAAVIVGERCDRLGHHITAETVADFVNQEPTHRVGFAAIDASADTVAEDIDRAIELGLTGLALAPAVQNIRPTDDRCMQTLEIAASKGMPVLIANPLRTSHPESMLEFARPGLLDEAARSIDNLHLIFGDLDVFQDETFLMLAKHERCFAEISAVAATTWSLRQTLVNAYERNAIHKIFLGSGFPNEKPGTLIERIYTINGAAGAQIGPLIPRRILQGIVERDAFNLVGIEHFAPSRQPITPATDEPTAIVTDAARRSLRAPSSN